MWERAELKRRAKRALKGSYWKALLVTIVMGITSGSTGSVASRDNFNTSYHSGRLHGVGDKALIFLIASIIIVIVLAIGVGIKILIGYHLQVGGRRYFIQAAQGDVNMGYLSYGFNKGRYSGIIKSMFWKDLMIFLWSLLLVIPGIIKSYAYFMVPYIVADNPQIGHKRALELSSQMTNGHKLDIWLLQVSFIGWYLLGMLACFVGIIFVGPYEKSTMAELYLVLRQEAIEKGLCDYQELNLVKVAKTVEWE